MKTAVLLSGGVDSSVALRLLQEEGTDLTAYYLKVWLEDGWVLLRPSNTQPVMRMFIEARTPERLSEIRTEFTAEYEQALASLSG